MDHVVRTGDHHNVDDVFHDDEGSSDAASEHTRLLPSTTVSESVPSPPPPLMSQPARLNVVQNSDSLVTVTIIKIVASWLDLRPFKCFGNTLGDSFSTVTGKVSKVN